MGLLQAGMSNIKRTCYLCTHCICEKANGTQKFTCNKDRCFARANLCYRGHFKERAKPIIVNSDVIGVKRTTTRKNLIIRETLRYKKGIAILAIILGFFRFLSGINILTDIYVKFGGYSAIDLILGYGELGSQINGILQISRFIVIIGMGLCFCIFIWGIRLLLADKKTYYIDSRKKSYKLNKAILSFSVMYALCEIVFLVIISRFSLGREIISISITSLLLSLSFVGVLILLASLGFRPVKKTTVTIEASIKLPVKETKALAKNSIQCDSIDDEIIRLRKKIEKRKLEKELEELE